MLVNTTNSNSSNGKPRSHTFTIVSGLYDHNRSMFEAMLSQMAPIMKETMPTSRIVFRYFLRTNPYVHSGKVKTSRLIRYSNNVFHPKQKKGLGHLNVKCCITLYYVAQHIVCDIVCYMHQPREAHNERSTLAFSSSNTMLRISKFLKYVMTASNLRIPSCTELASNRI